VLGDIFSHVISYLFFPSLIELLSWMALICYSLCYIPQIIENYRFKSTSGLSNIFVLTIFLSHVPLLYYTFMFDFLWSYKVMVPIESILVSLIFFQRFYYDSIFTDKHFLLGLLFFVFGMIFILFSTRYFCVCSAAKTCGWLSCGLFMINPWPQIMHVYTTKSVRGFSFAYALITGGAALCEIIVVYARGLPVQTFCMASKGFLVFLIFSVQFYLYRE